MLPLIWKAEYILKFLLLLASASPSLNSGDSDIELSQDDVHTIELIKIYRSVYDSAFSSLTKQIPLSFSENKKVLKILAS